ASGIEALEVLPYSSMLTATRSMGRPMRRAAASMMRKFAWCGTHRSISSRPTPAVLQTSVAWRMKMSTANLKTSGPTMSMNGDVDERRRVFVRVCALLDVAARDLGVTATVGAQAPAQEAGALGRRAHHRRARA